MDTKIAIQNYWDYRSESYNSVTEQSEYEKSSWMNMLSSTMDGRKELKILDVGTGPGFLALICAEMGNDVTAVDLSENMLKKARENAQKRSLSIEMMQGDAENLQFPDAHFDVVMNKYLLWTLPDPTKALLEWRRVLKEDGMIIAIDGDWHNDGLFSRTQRAIYNTIKTIKEDKYPRVFKKHYEPLKKDLPLFSLKPGQVISYFKNAGFKDVSIEKMDKYCDHVKKKDKLLAKLEPGNPVYLIKAKKNQE
jgi:ubiquinone/menaquinone biosynthesis C-methylase UbiE